MPRAVLLTRRATLFALLSAPAIARADEVAPPASARAPGHLASANPTSSSAAPSPPPSSRPPASGRPGSSADAPIDDACSDAAQAWAKGASQRAGLAITAVACPVGVVRLRVAGAGCDFEVARQGGFQRTADGAFGVSPIADLDWDKAPEPMKKAFAGILSALAQDPSLPIRTGTVVRHTDRERGGGGSMRIPLIAGAGVTAVTAIGLGIWWKRRKAKPASS